MWFRRSGFIKPIHRLIFFQKTRFAEIEKEKLEKLLKRNEMKRYAFKNIFSYHSI